MNSNSSRLRRVPPERSTPIRNPLIRQSTRVYSAPGNLRNALECGVQTAYAVIDEYMRRGYEAASHNQNTRNGEGHMSNEGSNYGWSNPWGPMTPLMAQWTAAMRMWADACAAFIPGMRQFWPPQGWPASATGYPVGAAPSAVSVEVSSDRPTEVSLYLKPGADLTQLRADSFEPPLRHEISISPKNGGIYVRVTIAKDQPSGEYHGAVRAADGSIVGDVTVAVAQAANDPA